MNNPHGNSHSKHTVVEEGTHFKGTLSSTCPIDVRGRVEGDIETPALTVSQSGAVHGRVKVGEVRSEGELSGEFDADKIELAGVVRDNTVIKARSLEVKLSSARGKLQVVFGECELSIGDEPTDQVVVEKPSSILAPPPVVQAPLAAEPARAFERPSQAPAFVPPPPSLFEPPPEAEAMPEAERAAETAEEEAGDASGRKKRKNGRVEETGNSWSQPPSQPPPAS